MAIRDGAQPSARPYVVVCDTTTGRCWVANLMPAGGQGWRNLGSPGDVPVIDPAAIEAPRLDPPEGSKIDGDAPPRISGTITPLPAGPRNLPPPAVIPQSDAIPALPLPSIPNDLPRAVPPTGELPPLLPGQKGEPH
jgi:hypothetical protein